jgi:hypothetical protein
MKSREEVEKLKRDWLHDGCWDIETTEGFEDYTDELLKFRRDTEAGEKIRRENHHKELADKLCPMTFPAGSKEYDDYFNCVVEKCAWWSSEEEKCAVVASRFLKYPREEH